MDKHIFDAAGDVVSTVSYDPTEKTVTYAQWQDVSPVWEQNKALQDQDGYNQGRDMCRVASIPPVVLLQWLRNDGISPLQYFRKPRAYDKWLRRKIYDRDNSFVLTAPHK